MDTFKWHKQSEDDIVMAVDDFRCHIFACMMKDGKLEKFSGMLDDTYDGEVSPIIDCLTTYNRDIDDIDMWIEIPVKLN